VGAADFMPAFVTVGLIAMSSVLLFLSLPHDAGAEVSGHRIEKKLVAELEKQPAE
jgi:hypothetical protein